MLRADVHRMFDLGYVGVHPKSFELMVNPRLREEFGNGAEFYRRAGSPIALPVDRRQRPASEYLTWHLDEVFNRPT